MGVTRFQENHCSSFHLCFLIICSLMCVISAQNISVYFDRVYRKSGATHAHRLVEGRKFTSPPYNEPVRSGTVQWFFFHLLNTVISLTAIQYLDSLSLLKGKSGPLTLIHVFLKCFIWSEEQIFHLLSFVELCEGIINNYPLKWRWLVIDIYNRTTYFVLVLTKQVDFVFAGVASSFIWRISFSVRVAKRAAILKISYGGGYPRIYTVSDEPVRAREKCYPPVWLTLKLVYPGLQNFCCKCKCKLILTI